MKRLVANLLHVANSDPPFDRLMKDRFYAMKRRILHRLASEDGIDLQHFEGKRCWGCGGSGMWINDLDHCYRCEGSGWYRSPRVIKLKRWRLADRVFHEPILTEYRRVRANERIVFQGRVEHANYSWQQARWATVVLAMFLDPGLAIDQLHRIVKRSTTYYRVTQFFNRRCDACDRRLWSWTKWRCSPPCGPRVKQSIEDQREISF